MRWIKMPKIKGKYWGLVSGHRLKKNAKKAAQYVRNRGKHARVIFHNTSGNWEVYSYDYPKRMY